MDSKLVLLAALVSSLAVMNFSTTAVPSVQGDFEAFKLKYGRTYADSNEEAYRLAVYIQQMNKINTHNAKEGETYSQGENQFTDFSDAEFRNIFLGWQPRPSNTKNIHTDETFVGDINWVTKGKVQKVKNQGQCGSCWAFSTVASTESLSAIATGTLGDFSEQQLVDCCYWLQLDCTCMGCSGGNMDQGFGYFKSHGICTEQSYPYHAKRGSCQAGSCTKSSFTISGHTDVTAGSTSALKSACDKQPVSIAVDAQNWSSYKSGIYSNCGTKLDHGVLLAGYTSSYWLVKNSWAATWGEQGYIRLAPGNTCGLANTASYPNH